MHNDAVRRRRQIRIQTVCLDGVESRLPVIAERVLGAAPRRFDDPLAEAMLDWYSKLGVQVHPVVLSDIVNKQIWTELGEHAPVHCSDAVMMSPGRTVFDSLKAPAGESSLPGAI